MSRRLPFGPLVVCLPLLAIAAAHALAADVPPQAAVREVTDTYFGTKIVDPYRWMEDAKNPEYAAWVKAQADYADGYLARIPLRHELLKRLEVLSNETVEVSGVRRVGQKYFYYKTAPGQNDRALYVRDRLDGAERLLIDAGKLASDGKRYSIMSYSPSHDGRYVSYIASPGGAEEGILRVIETASGRDVGERIDRARWGAGSWLPDNRSFVYWRRRPLAPGEPATDTYQKSRIYLHVLGTDPESDRAVFGYEVHPELPMSPTLFPGVSVPRGSKYAIAQFETGVSRSKDFYIAPVTALTQRPIPWRKVAAMADKVSDVAVHDDDLYLLIYETPRRRVLRTSAKNPDIATAHEVAATTRVVISGIAAARDGLYVQMHDGGVGKLFRLDYRSNALHPIALPYDGSVYGLTTDAREPGAIFGMHSWMKSPRYYAYDATRKAPADTGLQPPSAIDVSGFEAIEVKVRSHDGTMVPLSIVYKRGLERHGRNPTLLSGYGAYGSTLFPSFNPRAIAWLERGGVLAVAHVRGGGEYGAEWHLAGQKLTKPNTWKDFIACAEYLVNEKYTSPAHLAGQGRSAGGILIGNAIAERPDLFAAAIINVGSTNSLRKETTPNGVPNIVEFGSVKTKEGFDGLLAMDAYHKIKDRTPYPAVLLTHGINDPRVEPWLSAKMAARLQAASTSGKPVLLRIEYDSGHGLGSTKRQRNEEQADVYAFLFDQLGGAKNKKQTAVR